MARKLVRRIRRGTRRHRARVPTRRRGQKGGFGFVTSLMPLLTQVGHDVVIAGNQIGQTGGFRNVNKLIPLYVKIAKALGLREKAY